MARISERTNGATDEEPELDPRIQDILGRSLKAHYDDIVAAPMPDRFLVLLAQLEATERLLPTEGEADERR